MPPLPFIMGMKKLATLILTVICTLGLAQSEQKPVQISGMVITADSMAQNVPNAHVMVKTRKIGTITGGDGFFSLAVMPGDTITVSVIGFRKEELVISDTLKNKGYLARVVLKRDTTMLQEVTLYPWPTPENFKQEFLATNIPTTKEDIAMRNLALQELKARAAEMGYGADEIQRYAILMQEQNIYYNEQNQIYSDGGTAILGRLTDPFAWARFIKSLSDN